MNNDLYNVYDLPLSSDKELRLAQEKILNNEELTMKEKIRVGRDKTVKFIGDYELKPDHVYRAVSIELLDKYYIEGEISGASEDDEYIENLVDGKFYSNNKGVDWYLGGASFRYGEFIIECPAYAEYFRPTYDNGCGMSIDPTVRHFKSSGYKNKVPMSLVTRVFDINNLQVIEKENKR